MVVNMVIEIWRATKSIDDNMIIKLTELYYYGNNLRCDTFCRPNLQFFCWGGAKTFFCKLVFRFFFPRYFWKNETFFFFLYYFYCTIILYLLVVLWVINLLYIFKIFLWCFWYFLSPLFFINHNLNQYFYY